jgi:hypothetical protein
MGKLDFLTFLQNLNLQKKIAKKDVVEIIMSYCLNNLQSTLEYAIAYKKNGFSVISLYKKSKRPSLYEWDSFKKSYASNEQLENWFPPHYYTDINNIGIITGKASSIFAIDIDGNKAYEYYLSKLESLSDRQLIDANEKTMKIKTGSGNINIVFGFNPHEFVQDELKNLVLWRDTLNNTDSKFEETNNSYHKHSEIRLKGEGAYIVAPPSIHPNNNRYTLVNGINPIVLTREQIDKLVDVFITDNNNSNKNHNTYFQNKSQNDEKTKDLMEIDEETVLEIVSIVKPYYYDGIRNDFILYFSGWLRKLGLSYDNAVKIVKELAKEDEERNSRIITLRETYQKQVLEKISGYSGLLALLSNQLDEETGITKLKMIEAILEKNNFIQKSSNYFQKYNNKENTNSSENNNNSSTNSEKLIQTVERNIKLLFTDQYDTAFAQIKIKDYEDTIKIESKRFSRLLAKLYYDNTGKVMPSDAINNAVNILQAKAEFEGEKYSLSVRVATYNNPVETNEKNQFEIHYDLADSKRRCVKISYKKWEVVNNPPIPLFVRYNQTEQDLPASSYDLDILDKLIDLTNVKKASDRKLLKIYIITLFISDIPHAILLLHGDKGAAKSTLEKLIKLLVDPTKPILLTIPKDRSEFIQQAYHNHVIYYDNLKYIPNWFSDEVCKIVTGVGSTKRKLYSDDEDIVYELKRCLGVNGINISLTEPDALDRSILIELERIDDGNLEEKEIINKLLEIRPQILGYIFNVIVKAIQIKPSLKIGNLPRMADFALWGEAIARAMNYKENEFIRLYKQNIGQQNIEAIEFNSLATAIVRLVESWDNKQEGEQVIKEKQYDPQTLLNILNLVAAEYGIDTSNHHEWPKDIKWLSRRLKIIRSNLLEGLGIDVIVKRNTTVITTTTSSINDAAEFEDDEKESNDSNNNKNKNKKNTSIIIIRKITPLSPLTPPPTQINTNQEQNNHEIGGDILSNEKNNSINSNLSPPKNGKEPSQNCDGGDSGDSGDIFRLNGRVNKKDDEVGQKKSNYNNNNGNGNPNIENIYRKYPGSDIWGCNLCKFTGDKWFMLKHPCRGIAKKPIKEFR